MISLINYFYHKKGSICYGKGLYGPVINETTIFNRFPELVFKQEQVNGICRFIPHYNHLNQLIAWDRKVNFHVHHSPKPCVKEDYKKELILFGIKE